MIPVLGVPVLNGHDLLFRMLASVDHPVGRKIVIDNGPGQPWPSAPFDVEQIAVRHNLGVSASWNLIIKMTPLVRWWLITNHDVVFEPGALAALADAMKTSSPRLAMLHGLVAFGLNAEAVDRVGFFDENFVPAYYEDNDYVYRCKLAGVQIVELPPRLHHDGSSTIKGEYRFLRQNSQTFRGNREYYQRKWGGVPGQETFTTPFNQPGDVRSWTLSFRRLRDQTWK